MTLVLLVLLIVLFIVVVNKEKRMTERIDRLERLIVFLKDELAKSAGQAAAPDAAVEPEPAATQQPPAEPESGALPIQVREPAFTHAASAPEESTDEEKPEDIETMAPETLEDLILPDEEEPVAVEPSPEPAAEPFQPPPPKSDRRPDQAPSAWAERWQAFKANVDWEQFTGVKLFAWLGGLAFFIAAGLFVKVSIDRNWIPPALRLAVSALVGVGLIIGAGRFKDLKYRVMRHTLAAGGIGVLYSVVFAATLYYQYLTKPLGFAMLALVSAAAFVLAVFYRSKAVCLLGAVGAYATPILVSTGQDALLLLFGYLAVVNTGLYLVARRLISQGLLLAAAAGTLATLGFGTLGMFEQTGSTIIAVTWIFNLALFVFFLAHSDADPDRNPSTRWAGIVSFAGTLLLAVALLLKSGWAPLLVVTTAQAAAIFLAGRRRGWYRYLVPWGVVGFMVALTWVLFNFSPAHFSTAFILLLLYGALGGIGPLVPVYRYGLDPKVRFWFRAFPLAIVLVSLVVIVRQPVVSFWFWPLLLGLELIGIGISILIRAFVQVALLVLIFVLGALNWLFHVPSDALGLGFFLFLLGAGIVMCAGVFVLIRRMPDLLDRLNLEREGASPGQFRPSYQLSEQWLAAAPAAGMCVLLAASFFVNYPNYPHPGMATLTCFLLLALFAVRRLGYEIPGVAALIGAAAAQAVFVCHPVLGPPACFYALVWSGLLFPVALIAPFLFFRDTGRWKRLWHGWAVFEMMQALFILFAGQWFWRNAEDQWMAQWVPLVLAVLKLPLVALLLRRLEGQPQRNSILAFHGGVLLFYISTLPVLVLDHGWIGLTFVLEATALLWLNRRITHPGLRWVALTLAPAGLAIVLINLPQLKTVQSLPLLNSAVLTTLMCTIALTFAARLAGFPGRMLGRIDLPNYFLWLGVATGFVLINLTVADIFAEPGTRFKVWPDRGFVQWACYALFWVALGGLLRRLTRLPGRFRTTGLLLIAAGAVVMIALPMVLPEAAAHMRPLLNTGMALYLPLLAALYFLFHKEPWQDPGSIVKNCILALFLIAAFITFKLQKNILMEPGYPFALLTSHTPARGATSAAAWLFYGLGLLLWPRRLDRPFRMAGMVLILLGAGKALLLPFKFRVLFAQMTPLLNMPTLIYVICLAVLVYLTLRQWDGRWPVPGAAPRLFWGVVLALAAFAVLNIEIASVFGLKDRPFSMMTHGSLPMQLAYSIGWLLYAIGLLIVGIRWSVAPVRLTALAAIVATAFKIFILDLWSLGSMYRVGSVLCLAVVLVLVSFLYQRFFSEGNTDEA